MAKSSFYIRANVSDEVYKAISDISRYDQETQDKLKNIVKEKTDLVFTYALQGIRIYTGFLAKSIEHEYSTGIHRASGKVFTKAPHGHLLEFGHNGGLIITIRRKALRAGADGWFMHRAVARHQSAHPFMKPAMDRVRPDIEADVKAAIAND